MDTTLQTPPKPSRSASVRFIVVTLVFDALGFGLVVPIMPSLVVHLSGLTVSGASRWVGVLLSTFAVMQFICAPILGGLSDRFGRRPVLLLSLAGGCANYLLLAWAPSVAWLFLGRIIAGTTAASASTAMAYIADITPPEKRAAQFGIVGASFAMGFVVGPALGGLLGAYGLRVPFLAAAAMAGCNVLYGLFVLPESLSPALRRKFDWKRANPFGSLKTLAAHPMLGRLAVAWAAIWFAMGALQSTFVLANQARFDWGTRQNGLALAMAGLGGAIVQGFLVRKIIPRLGERHSAMVGAVLNACGYALIAVAPFGGVVLAGIVFMSMGAITNPSIQGMVSAIVGPTRQGETQGALSSIQGLTAIFAPLIATTVFAFFTSTAAPLNFAGAPFIGSALAFMVVLWVVSRVHVKIGPRVE